MEPPEFQVVAVADDALIVTTEPTIERMRPTSLKFPAGVEVTPPTVTESPTVIPAAELTVTASVQIFAVPVSATPPIGVTVPAPDFIETVVAVTEVT